MPARVASARTGCPCEYLPFSTSVRLRDGALVRLRDAEPADLPRLRQMFFALSDTTRYLYFCAGVPRNDVFAERVAALGRADPAAAYAMVVEVDGELVGVARFDLDDAGQSAEIGILVADTWQSRGLGTKIVAHLRAEALCRELSGFTGTVMGENFRAFRLLRRAFPTLRATLSYGQYSVVMPFVPPTDGAA